MQRTVNAILYHKHQVNTVCGKVHQSILHRKLWMCPAGKYAPLSGFQQHNLRILGTHKRRAVKTSQTDRQTANDQETECPLGAEKTPKGKE